MNKKGSFDSEPALCPVFYLLGTLFIILLIALISFSAYEESKTDYKMPNGVICKDKLRISNRLEFSQCSDGKVYIDPESYKEIKR